MVCSPRKCSLEIFLLVFQEHFVSTSFPGLNLPFFKFKKKEKSPANEVDFVCEQGYFIILMYSFGETSLKSPWHR